MSKRSLKVERFRGRIERGLLKCQATALEDLKKVQTDEKFDEQKWQDRSTRTVVNLKFAEIAAAGIRAKQMADAGPKVFGVVAVVNRIDDHARWEEMARAIDAGKEVIDVEVLANDSVHEKDVHRPRRAVGGLPGKLGGGVPEEGEASGKEEEQEQGNQEAGLLAKAGGR